MAKRKQKRTEARDKVRAAADWYAGRRPLFLTLCKVVVSILQDVLDQEGVEYQSVTWRAKDDESFARKAESYNDPTTEIHDCAGVRVVVYVESEATKTAAIVRDLFEIDPDNSVDKTSELGVDRMGYRAVHYVAGLGDERTNLREMQKYSGVKFEVQVRTVLQHAWAEIEHGRNYKFSGVLPPEIQRRFAVLAGSVELIDREFDHLAAEIDSYAEEVADKASKGNLDIAIDTISLREYLKERFREHIESGAITADFGADDGNKVVSELEDFGIHSLAELDALITSEFLSASGRPHGRNFSGTVRDIMVISDCDRYFDVAWKHHWTTVKHEALSFWSSLGVDRQVVLDHVHLPGHEA